MGTREKLVAGAEPPRAVAAGSQLTRSMSGRPSLLLLPVLAMALLLAACAHLPNPIAGRATANADIWKQRQKFNELVALRKMDDLAALLADDVQVIAPLKVTSGKKNLVRSQQTLVQRRPDLVQIFTPDHVERNPRWPYAAESGHWVESWQEQGETTEVRGSYYAQWKLKDGHWRLVTQVVTPVSCKGATYCKSQE